MTDGEAPEEAQQAKKRSSPTAQVSESSYQESATVPIEIDFTKYCRLKRERCWDLMKDAIIHLQF